MLAQGEPPGDEQEQQGAQTTTVQEISGGQHGETYMGGQFGQYIQTQVNKTYNPVGATGQPHKEGEFQVGSIITVHENCPISLSSRIFNATLHSGVTGDKKAAVKITAAEKKNYREAKVHFSVPHHKNIVERIATDTFNFRGQPSIFIAMELCDCNLYDHVQSEKNDEIPFDAEKYIWIAYQTLQGLAFLHLYKVVHGDLKPPNVLLILNGNIIKLSDFGLSKPITSGKDSTVLTSPQAGTLGWQAPEILKGAKKISTATDIFPGGLVLYFVFSHGEHAYGDEMYSLSHNIAKGINQYLGKMRIPNSNIAEPLVRQMLEIDPTKRPTAKQALKNKIFDSFGPKLQKVADFKLHEIIDNAVEAAQSQPSQVEANQCSNDVEEVIPLGVTLTQLSTAMDIVFKKKKIDTSGPKLQKVADSKLHEIIDNAVEAVQSQPSQVKANQCSNDVEEVIPLGVTLTQLSTALDAVFKKKKIDTSALSTTAKEKGQQSKKTDDPWGKEPMLGLLQVFIRIFDGRVITLQVKDSDTIKSIKHLIAYKEAIPPNDQCLYFNGVQLSDDCTLSQYNIENESVINLGKIQICVQMLNGATFTLHVKPSDTIGSVKKQIERVLVIPLNQQRLIFAGKRLENANTLSDYGIQANSMLHLIDRLQ